jgi:hypothetical protein
MVTFVQLLPVGLSALVLAAHFLRSGNVPLLLASLAMIFLMFVRRSWAARVIRLGLLFGTIEWVRTLMLLIATRKELGQPYTRLGIILGAVAAVTAASALVFRTRRLRQRFQLSVS